MKNFFFNFKSGKLKRLRYFLYSLVTYILHLTSFIAFIQNPQSTPIALTFILMTLIFIYLSVLLLVKRFRDMGLPPLISSIIYWVTFLTLMFVASNEIYYAVIGIVSLAICLSPSNSFSKVHTPA